MTQIAETESPAAYWESQIEAWRDSGVSQAEYCKANNLRYSRFLYWRRKLEQANPEQGGIASSGFARVAVPGARADLSIALPGGQVIHGITADNLSVVQQLLAQLS
jgi:hypothetical protein